MFRNILVLMLLVPFMASAQDEKAKTKPQFVTSGGIALLIGQSEPAPQWQVVNGLKFNNNWFVGAGAGMDYYRFRSVPIFLSVKKEGLFKKPLFAYVDGGVALPAATEAEKAQSSFFSKFYTGFYSELGLGWSIKATRKTSYLLSLGYSIRTMKDKATMPSFSSFWPSPDTEMTTNYTFHVINFRISMNLDW